MEVLLGAVGVSDEVFLADVRDKMGSLRLSEFFQNL